MKHGYTVTADFGGHVPPERLENLADEILPRLERVAIGPVVGASMQGIDLIFSLEYSEARDLDDVAARGREIAEKLLAGVGLNLPMEALRVQTYARQELELEAPNFPELVGLSEIAEILDVSKQRASQLREHPDFPKPLAELRAGDVWARESLNHFIETWPRRGGRQRTWAVVSPETVEEAGIELTDREGEILTRMAMMGGGIDELADELGISVDTVRRHLRSIHGKLADSRRVGAIRTEG